jgi:hypothetical protein
LGGAQGSSGEVDADQRCFRFADGCQAVAGAAAAQFHEGLTGQQVQVVLNLDQPQHL